MPVLPTSDSPDSLVQPTPASFCENYIFVDSPVKATLVIWLTGVGYTGESGLPSVAYTGESTLHVVAYTDEYL